MKKIPKKGTLARAKKDCWDAFSLLKKLESSKDGEWTNCYTCGKPIRIGTSDCQGGHLFPKKSYSGIWLNENNVRPQCYHCNCNLGGNGAIFADRMRAEVGDEEYERMKGKMHDEFKLTKKEYAELEKQYRDRITKIKEKW